MPYDVYVYVSLAPYETITYILKIFNMKPMLFYTACLFSTYIYYAAISNVLVHVAFENNNKLLYFVTSPLKPTLSPSLQIDNMK